MLAKDQGHCTSIRRSRWRGVRHVWYCHHV